MPGSTEELANQQTAKEITIAVINRSSASLHVDAESGGKLASDIYSAVLKAVVAAKKF